MTLWSFSTLQTHFRLVSKMFCLTCVDPQLKEKCKSLQITEILTLKAEGAFAGSQEWTDIEATIIKAVTDVDWPVGSGKFTIYPESGKKSGMGNGVKPIKTGMMRDLETLGWILESPYTADGQKTKDKAAKRLPKGGRPGDFDAVFESNSGVTVVEWETGNISSSHRAINKMALGLLHGIICAGVLVVPSGKMAPFLTDRVGNWPEISPYTDLWRSLPITEGVLKIIVIEHDAKSFDVPRIPKGTDGRAAR